MLSAKPSHSPNTHIPPCGCYVAYSRGHKMNWSHCCYCWCCCGGPASPLSHLMAGWEWGEEKRPLRTLLSPPATSSSGCLGATLIVFPWQLPPHLLSGKGPLGTMEHIQIFCKCLLCNFTIIGWRGDIVTCLSSTFFWPSYF